MPSDYNVTWTTPSRDSLDSMPLSGSRGAGANVWVQDGSVWIYPGHNSAYDENGRQMKLGCVRLTPPSDVLAAFSEFRQELDLASGAILISARSGEKSLTLRLWYAGENLIVEGTNLPEGVWQVAFATWRDVERQKLKLDMWATHTIQPDKVEVLPEGIVWSHRNADHPSWRENRAKAQGLQIAAVLDNTRDRVFGGAIAAAGGMKFVKSEPATWQFWPGGTAWIFETPAGDSLSLAIATRSEPSGDPAKWFAQAQAALEPAALQAARTAEATRWKAFWERSHVFVNPKTGAEDPAWQMGRNYALFRYMLACNQGGELPLLFNGGIFTTDNPPGRIKGNNNNELPISPGAPMTPDFRRWMYCGFMSQNQRWLGWPALANGDEDLLQPTLAFYRDRAGVAAQRAKNLGAEGVVYTEPIDVWGLCATGDRPDGLCGHEHLTYHFSMMLEHAWMALQGHKYFGADLSKDREWILGTLRFYDSFYRKKTKERTGSETDVDGKLVIYPASAIEGVIGATDPSEVMAALHALSDALVALPRDVLPPEEKKWVESFRATLPPLPVGQRDGKESVLIAKSYEKEYNQWEFPEMYAAWPYRRIGVTRPGTLELARNTYTTVQKPWADKVKNHDYSWMPNIVNAASIGAADEAGRLAIDKLSDKNAQVRFPAFFGPGHDWLPDHNHGGSASTGLQEMLLAAEPKPNGKIYLLPAWPKDWDVKFKLHAPGGTVVECDYADGKVKSLKVTPAAREKDVEILAGKLPPMEGLPTSR